MKRNVALNALALIDEEYVKEADPDAQKSRPRLALHRLILIASVVVIAVMTLFVPLALGFDPTLPNPTLPEDSTSAPDSLAPYRDSPYFSLIEYLFAAQDPLPYYPEWGGDSIEQFDPFVTTNSPWGYITELPPYSEIPTTTDGGWGAIIPNPSTTTAKDTDFDRDEYTPRVDDITDVQTPGVEEGDLLKRTETHFFYLSKNALTAYPITGSVPENTCSLSLSQYTQTSQYDVRELYLSENGKRATVLLSYRTRSENLVTILTVDISKPQKELSVKGSITFSGTYQSARLSDGTLLLTMTQYVPNTCDFNNKATFVPYYEKFKKRTYLDMDDIIIPETAYQSNYTLIYVLEAFSTKILANKAYLGYHHTSYITKDTLYLVTGYYKAEGDLEADHHKRVNMSDIYRFSLKDHSLALLGKITVPGSVNDRFSLDEYGGYLRIVTTTQETAMKRHNEDRLYSNGTVFRKAPFYTFSTSVINASLYVVELTGHTVITSVESFAPAGERVNSARFDGLKAYVCTSVVMSDPVFFFDLSDYQNITYTDTGEIEGFSSSLIHYPNGKVLGVGVDGSGSTKLEVYQRGEDTVESLDSIVLDGMYHADDYRSFYINRQKGFFGLTVVDHLVIPSDTYQTERVIYYRLYQLDGESLREIASVRCSRQNRDVNPAEVRAAYVDGYLYVFFGSLGMRVVNIDAPKPEPKPAFAGITLGSPETALPMSQKEYFA